MTGIADCCACAASGHAAAAPPRSEIKSRRLNASSSRACERKIAHRRVQVSRRLAPRPIPHYISRARPVMSINRRPADIARLSAKALQARPRDAFRRETFALPREKAREKAREMFRRFPKAAYMTEIESWRELPGDRIEFTMRRLPSAD